MDSNAVISLDFALKDDNIYHPEVFLKERNYIEKKVVIHINENFSDFFLMMMSLMKNKLEWVKFFVIQLPQYLVTHGDPPVVQNKLT